MASVNVASFTAILGLGKTGMSYARYLAQQAKPFIVMDSRQEPPELTTFRQEFPHTPVYRGPFDNTMLEQADEILISPGIALQEPAISRQIVAGKSVMGDVELFARVAKAPITAITGSNGKSTVTTLLGNMVVEAGLKVQVAGNIGLPVLDVLAQPVPDWYIVELSSFQLETTKSLQPYAAIILNITEDHMDRYATFADYKQAKHRIFNQCQYQVYNRQDKHTQPADTTVDAISFGLDKPQAGTFGIVEYQQQLWLAKAEQLLIPTRELRLVGKHNWANALAALALGDAMQLPMAAMLTALKKFGGLAHRCEWVAEKNSVHWYNDSKATNVGAAIAAIEGLGQTLTGKLLVLAGGVGKEADFSPLSQLLAKYARAIILFGLDAAKLGKIVPASVSQFQVQTMEDAVQIATQYAQAGDAVLLAPACASFDMFNNFEHRGDVFKALVKSSL